MLICVLLGKRSPVPALLLEVKCLRERRESPKVTYNQTKQ